MIRPKICAHAAGADLGPSNSLEAARASLETLAPTDLIELDVQETRDGELVLLHGGVMDSIRFVFGGHSATRDLTLNDLRAVDSKVATLDEMLALIAGRCGIVLDIKDSRINKGKLKEVVRHQHTGEVYLTATDRRYLRDSAGELADWPKVVQCRTATREQIDDAIASCNPKIIDIWPPFLTQGKAAYIKSRGLDFVPGGMVKPFSRMGEGVDRIRWYAKHGALYILTFDPVRGRHLLEDATT